MPVQEIDAIGVAGVNYLAFHYEPPVKNTLSMFNKDTISGCEAFSSRLRAMSLKVGLTAITEYFKTDSYLISEYSYSDVDRDEKLQAGINRRATMIIPRTKQDPFDQDTIWKVLDEQYTAEGAKSEYKHQDCPPNMKADVQPLRDFLAKKMSDSVLPIKGGPETGLLMINSADEGDAYKKPEAAVPWTFGPIPVDPDHIFFQTPNVIGMVNLRSHIPRQLLLVTRRMVATPLEMTREEIADLFEAGYLMAHAFKLRYGDDVMSLGIQTGDAAGQSIKHVHMHVCPIPEPGFEPGKVAGKTSAEMKLEAFQWRATIATVKRRDNKNYQHILWQDTTPTQA